MPKRPMKRRPPKRGAGSRQAQAVGACIALIVALAAGVAGQLTGNVELTNLGQQIEQTVLGGESGAGGNSSKSSSTSSSSAASSMRDETADYAASVADLGSVPEYTSSPYAVIAATGEHELGTPSFTKSELTRAKSGTFKLFSDLDRLGRCGTALACLGTETQPTGERKSISSVKPTGWRQAFYCSVDQEALYNRCHLIAWSLSGENANPKNLVTGTRYLNVSGMLPFEERLCRYIESTGNHVLYRVTPIFEGEELVCRGVHLEAQSVEDNGASICFNVYCYNVQPNIQIDYATGASREA